MPEINVDNGVVSHADANQYINNRINHNHHRYGASDRCVYPLSDGSIITQGKRNNNGQTALVRWTLNGHCVWVWQNTDNDCYSIEVDEQRREVYVNVRNGNNYAVDLDTGETLWGPVSYSAGRVDNMAHVPGKDFIYAYINDNTLRKFRKSDGSDVPISYPFANNVRTYALYAHGDYLYYGDDGTADRDPKIYKLRLSDDTVVADSLIDSNPNRIAVDESGVYFEAGGLRKWTLDFADEVYRTDHGMNRDWYIDGDFLPDYNNNVYLKSSGKKISQVDSHHSFSPMYDGETYVVGDRTNGWFRFPYTQRSKINRRVKRNVLPATVSDNYELPQVNESEIRVRGFHGNNLTWRLKDQFTYDNSGNRVGNEMPRAMDIDSDDNLFVSFCPKGRIVAYNDQGTDLWEYVVGDEMTTMISADESGGLYYGTVNGRIEHIDSGGNQTFSVDQFDGPVHEIFFNGINLYACGSNQVKQISTTDGSQVWKYDTKYTAMDIAQEGDSGNIYIAVDRSKSVIEIDESDGQFVAEYEDLTRNNQNGNEFISALAWADGFFIVGDSHGYMYKFSPDFQLGWYQNSRQDNITSIDANEGAIVTAGTYGQASYTNHSVFVAERNCKVRVSSEEAERIYINGERCNNMNRDNNRNKRESRSYTFYLSEGDCISADGQYSVSGFKTN
jgi:hypothetical protein